MLNEQINKLKPLMIRYESYNRCRQRLATDDKRIGVAQRQISLGERNMSRKFIPKLFLSPANI